MRARTTANLRGVLHSTRHRRAIDTNGRVRDNESEPTPQADVAELADALDSGSSVRKDVEVQVLSSAPFSITYRPY